MFFAGRLTTATLTAGGASAESFDFPLSSSTGWSYFNGSWPVLALTIFCFLKTFLTPLYIQFTIIKPP